MRFLGALSSEAREELHAFVVAAVREELRARELLEAQREWLNTAELALALKTTDNAIRLRLQRGWLKDTGDRVKDGRGWLVRRSAVLAELDRRAGL